MEQSVRDALPADELTLPTGHGEGTDEPSVQ